MTPSLALYRALWEDAVECVLGVGRNTGGKPYIRRRDMARDHRDTIAWIRARDAGEITFRQVCEVLGVDPDTAAAGLLAAARPHALGCNGFAEKRRLRRNPPAYLTATTNAPAARPGTTAA